MKWRQISVAFGLLVAAAPSARAYEIGTHAEVLTRSAVTRSVLQTDPTVLRNLGLEKGIADRSQQFPNSQGGTGTIQELFEDGSRFEDNVSIFSTSPEIRPLKHFYNPITGRGLDIPVLPTQIASPDWALAPRGSNPDQQFSYWDARQHLFDALTKPTKADRDRAFGLAFQTLGQVLHHLQDMAAPQHVRNDAHCDSVVCKLIGAYAPSLYEKWTDSEAVRRSLPADPGTAGYDISSPLFASTFNSPRRFWHTDPAGPGSVTSGKGIAEFTNRNFVSAGTNFDKPGLFPSPVRDESRTVDLDIRQLCANANPPCPNPNLTGVITFYGNSVEDRYTGQTVNNPFASSLSIFDADLRKTTGTPLSQPRLFTLNRFNFALAHGFLIPRAVAFSAGMINYFFRGRLDAEPQGAGALLVKNLSAEAMQGDFSLYYDDAQGNRHPVTVTACRVGAVDVPVDQGKCKAAALASVNISPNSRLEVSFTSPVDPAPKSAGEYMLVFNGTLGEEKAEEGTVGAVVGKQIRAFSGTLYVSALDNLGRRVSLKADTSGTRVVQAGEFDPLLFATPFNPGPAKAYSMKQVVFTQTGPGQYSYEPLAVTIGNTSFGSITTTGLVKNSSTNTFEVTDGGSWLAKSPQPEIGEFTFRVVPDASGTNGSLHYTRRYRGADGTPATQTGSVALPTLVGSFEINYTSVASGGLFVSGDGLTVSGLRAAFQNVASGFEMAHYDLMIGLDITPTISLVERRREPFFSQTNVNQPFTQRIVGTVSTTPQCQEGAKPVQFNLIADSFRKEFRANQNEIRPIEYLNNNLASYRLTRVSTQLASGEREGGGGGVGEIFGPCSAVGGWVYSQTKGTVVERFEEERQAIFSDGVLMGSVGSTTTFFHNELQIHYGLPNRTWDYLYEGVGNAQPPIQFTSLPGPTVNNLRYTIVHALTDKLGDAIFSLSISGGPARTRFRSLDITGQSYVADASPVGEVFFAIADLSVVVHEPKGTTPKVVFPPNIVRLLSAVWF